MNFHQNDRVDRIIQGGLASADATTYSQAVDMAGYDDLEILTCLGDVSVGADVAVTLQTSDSEDSGFVDSTLKLSDTSVSNGLGLIGCRRPPRRYCRAKIERTGTAAIDAMVAVRGTPQDAQVTQGDAEEVAFMITPDDA